MNIVFDTSAFSRLLNRDQSVVGALAKLSAPNYFMPFCTEAELLAGYAYGTQQEHNLRRHEQVVSAMAVEPLYADDETLALFAEYDCYLRRNGRKLADNDIWVAALATQSASQLATFDTDFRYLPQVRLLPLN